MLTLLTSISVVVFIAYNQDYRCNFNSTYPVGLYQLNHQPIEHFRGELVLFCPPNNAFTAGASYQDIVSDGYCLGGFKPSIQKIIAMTGDRIDIRDGRVFVNNQEVRQPYSLELPFYSNNTLFTVQNNQFFMISDHHTMGSLDSRDFGPVHKDNIIASVEPVLILWGDHKPHEEVSEDK